MSQIRVGCEIEYQVETPSHFVFNVAVARNEFQTLESENLYLDPFLPIQNCEIGEHNRLHRIKSQAGFLRLSYTADVRVAPILNDVPQIDENSYGELPPEVLVYLNPSRYCESDKLAAFANREFGSMSHGHERVQTICDWTYQYLSYVSGTTDSQTTACDVLIGRAGVCRDFAHLAITMCRGLGIPARYVSGYAIGLEPPDFHGFLEAYLNDRWYLFDPTRLAAVGGLVRIASGRDAADTPFATIIGQATLQSMHVWAESLGENQLLQNNPYQTGISTA